MNCTTTRLYFSFIQFQSITIVIDQMFAFVHSTFIIIILYFFPFFYFRYVLFSLLSRLSWSGPVHACPTSCSGHQPSPSRNTVAVASIINNNTTCNIPQKYKTKQKKTKKNKKNKNICKKRRPKK